MLNHTRLIVALGFTALLGACGGGDGSNGTNGTNGTNGVAGAATVPAATVPATASSSFQVKSALVNYFLDTKTLTYTVQEVDSPLGVVAITFSGTGTLTQSSVSSATFEGVSGFQKTTNTNESIQMGANTTKVPRSSTSTGYTDSNYVPIGSSNDVYAVVTGAVTIPQTGVVGDKGPLYTENYYSSNAKSPLLGTTEYTFAIEPDTAPTALLKLTQVKKDTSGTPLSTSTTTFRMTLAGGLTRLSDTTVSSTISGSLTSTNSVTRTYQ